MFNIIMYDTRVLKKINKKKLNLLCKINNFVVTSKKINQNFIKCGILVNFFHF